MADLAHLEEAVVRRLEPLVGSDAATHFLHHKYLDAEKLLNIHDPSAPELMAPAARVLLGLCLVHRGYIGEGLREISITVELPKDSDTKVMALLLLYFGFMHSGLHTYAGRVLDEATKLDTDHVIEEIWKEADNPPPKPQEIGPVIGDVTLLKTRLFYFHTKANDLSLSILSLKSADDHALVRTRLKSMFELITNLVPESSPELYTNIGQILLDHEKSWYSSHPEGKKSKIKKHSVPVSELDDLVVLKTIRGYACLLEHQYVASFNQLEACLDILLSHKKSFDPSTCRSIAVLTAQAFIRIPSDHPTKHILHCDHLITEILNWSKVMNTAKEIRSGKLEHYFLTLGLLYMEKSVLQGSKVSNMGIQPAEELLEEAIRKLIIVTALKYPDDETIGDIYETIMTCCLLHGGFHLKLIWFFKFLMDFFRISSTLSHLLSDRWKLPITIEQLNESAMRKLEPIEFLRWHCPKEDRPNLLRDVPDPYQISIPLYYILYLDKTVSLRQSEMQLNKVEVSENIRKSDELICLWIKSFVDYKDHIPQNIVTFLEDYIDVEEQ